MKCQKWEYKGSRNIKRTPTRRGATIAFKTVAWLADASRHPDNGGEVQSRPTRLEFRQNHELVNRIIATAKLVFERPHDLSCYHSINRIPHDPNKKKSQGGQKPKLVHIDGQLMEEVVITINRTFHIKTGLGWLKSNKRVQHETETDQDE